MTKIITKKLIIKALQTEKLRHGDFFRSDKPNCTVCAVGAVLRHVSFESWVRNKLGRSVCASAIGDIATQNCAILHSSMDVHTLVQNKNYLGALSCYFEDGHTKRACIAFVKKYFPKSFKCTIKEENL